MLKNKTVAWDSLLLLLFASLLIWPLFHVEYLNYWPSIESTFIADARMLAAHLPHPGWQPLWYGGTRFDYIYPPALRYGTALLSVAAHISTARAYHLYTGGLYVFGIVAVYWLVRVGSRSRVTALLASIATALLSPSFLLLPLLRIDSGYWVPQRLHVLMAYGEGPHISALSILPAALAASFLALRKRAGAMLALAAALCAFAVANNFYGATALAISFPILVWSVWLGERDWHALLRAGGIVALAGGLSAFWLTPSYVSITLLNLKWVAEPGNAWSVWLALLVSALFCAGSLRLASRRPEREWTVFVTGLAVAFSLNVLGYYYIGFRLIGSAARLVPELDLVLILALAELVRVSLQYRKLRVVAAVLVVVGFLPAVCYVKHGWSPFPVSEPVQTRYEFRTTQWVHDHLAGERVFPSGSVRLWFDAWQDNAQPDGGSLQGMISQIIPVATWQVLKGSEAALAVLWLQALGTDAIVVPDKTSPEAYHDFSKPAKFQGAVPMLYDDKAGTAIYRIPRIHPGIGRVVDKQALAAAGSAIRGGDDTETLTKYVAAVENPAQPATSVVWPDYDHVNVQATVAEGQAVLLQETYDANWQAETGGRAVEIRREPVMGFMLLDLPAGRHDIRMHFAVPVENRVGQWLFGFSCLVILGLVLGGRRLRKLL